MYTAMYIYIYAERILPIRLGNVGRTARTHAHSHCLVCRVVFSSHRLVRALPVRYFALGQMVTLLISVTIWLKPLQRPAKAAVAIAFVHGSGAAVEPTPARAKREANPPAPRQPWRLPGYPRHRRG